MYIRTLNNVHMFHMVKTQRFFCTHRLNLDDYINNIKNNKSPGTSNCLRLFSRNILANHVRRILERQIHSTQMVITFSKVISRYVAIEKVSPCETVSTQLWPYFFWNDLPGNGIIITPKPAFTQISSSRNRQNSNIHLTTWLYKVERRFWYLSLGIIDYYY